MIRPIAGLLFFFTFASAVSAAPMQGGYTTKKHPSRGIDFHKPRRWDKLPVQPTEEWVRFQLIEPVPEKERDRRKLQPKIEIIDIPYVADPAPLTGEYGEEEPEDEGAGEEDAVASWNVVLMLFFSVAIISIVGFGYLAAEDESAIKKAKKE